MSNPTCPHFGIGCKRPCVWWNMCEARKKFYPDPPKKYRAVGVVLALHHGRF